MAPHRPRGVPSDRFLLQLWHDAVMLWWENKCVLSGFGGCKGDLEAHHIKRRNVRPLRYVIANGVPLCIYHHGQIKLRIWQRRLDEIVGPETMEWLDTTETQLLPDYLADHGWTRKGWLLATESFLKGMIGYLEAGDDKERVRNSGVRHLVPERPDGGGEGSVRSDLQH